MPPFTCQPDEKGFGKSYLPGWGLGRDGGEGDGVSRAQDAVDNTPLCFWIYLAWVPLCLLVRASFPKGRVDKSLVWIPASHRILCSEMASFVMKWGERLRGPECPGRREASAAPRQEELPHLQVSLWLRDRGLCFSISKWKLRGQNLVTFFSSS